MTVPVLYIRLTEEEAKEILSQLDDLVAERKKEARQAGTDTRGIGASTVALELLRAAKAIISLARYAEPGPHDRSGV